MFKVMILDVRLKALRTVLLSLGLVILSSCAIQRQRALRPKTLAFAQTLRGQTLKSVTTSMGSTPADSKNAGPNGEVAYFFVSEESENHPQPKPLLYAFVFEKDVLLKVEKAE